MVAGGVTPLAKDVLLGGVNWVWCERLCLVAHEQPMQDCRRLCWSWVLV
jgi:hypothetical protein